MPLVLTFFLLLACSPVPWPAPWFGNDPVGPIVFTTAVIGLTILRAVRISYRTCRIIHQPFRQSEALIGYQRGRSRQMMVLIFAFSFSLTAGGWGWFSRLMFTRVADGATYPGIELMVLAPFMIGLFASWLAFYQVERLIHQLAGEPSPTQWQYLRFQFRQQLALACIPVGLIIVAQTLTRVAPTLVEQTWFRLSSIALLLALLLTAPWLIRWLLGLKPLPAGPLRERLMSSAKRMRFRCSNIMVWNTGGIVANAMIAGILPFPRYVLFTDRLLEDLTPDEIESVFGHEVGHVRHRHMTLYMLFLGLSLAAFTGIAHAVDRWMESTGRGQGLLAWVGEWDTFVSLVSMAVYVVFAFGFLSRRCEREADLFGCRAVSCGRHDCASHESERNQSKISPSIPPCPTGIDTFVNALERVAVINGMSRSKPGWLASWQHGTIARRVDFLQRVRAVPGLSQRYRRKMNWLKAVIVLVLSIGVGVLIWSGDLPWQ